MKKLMFMVAAFMCLIGVQTGQAQVSFGPQLAWSDAVDLGLGARVEFGLADLFGIEDGVFANLYASASGTYFFPECPGSSCSLVELNPNAVVPFEMDATVTPFVGAGLHLARSKWSVPDASISDTDTDVGLNILGGIKFPIGNLGGFAEGNFGISGAEHFTLSAGVLFGDR